MKHVHARIHEGQGSCVVWSIENDELGMRRKASTHAVKACLRPFCIVATRAKPTNKPSLRLVSS